MNSCGPPRTRSNADDLSPIARKAIGNLRSDGPDFAQADIDGCPQAPLPQGHLSEKGQHKWGNKPQERGRRTGFISNSYGTKLSRYGRSPENWRRSPSRQCDRFRPTCAQALGVEHAASSDGESRVSACPIKEAIPITIPVASYRAAWHVASVRGCAARESPRTR